MKLKDKVAIITGGPRGIGKNIAFKFISEGAKVVVTSRTTHEINSCVSEIKSYGGSIIGIRADVSSIKDVDRLLKLTISEYGDVDILVNDAGEQGPIGLITYNDIEEWISTVKTNLIGTFLCTKAVLPTMIKKKYGKIVNLSGGGATSPRPRFSAYSSSKAAVVRLTETISEEVKEYHIDINAIAPGAVNTQMLYEVLNAGESAGEKEFREAQERLKNGGTSPELVANLALFLSSKESDGITGKLISAVWDPYKEKEFIDLLKVNKDIASLRRIDNKYFIRNT